MAQLSSSRGMLPEEEFLYSEVWQRLDAVFSNVQLNAIMGVFGAGWLTEHLKASVNVSPAMQQQPEANVRKVAEWILGLAHDV